MFEGSVRLSKNQRAAVDDALGEAPITAAIITAMECALGQYLWSKKTGGDVVWVSRFDIPFCRSEIQKIATTLSGLVDKTLAVRPDDPLVQHLADFRAELHEYLAMIPPRRANHRPVDKAMADAACRLVYDLVDCQLDITVKTDTPIVEVLDLFRHWADELAGRKRRRRSRTSKYEFARRIVGLYLAADLPHRSDKSASA